MMVMFRLMKVHLDLCQNCTCMLFIIIWTFLFFFLEKCRQQPRSPGVGRWRPGLSRSCRTGSIQSTCSSSHQETQETQTECQVSHILLCNSRALLLSHSSDRVHVFKSPRKKSRRRTFSFSAYVIARLHFFYLIQVQCICKIVPQNWW